MNKFQNKEKVPTLVLLKLIWEKLSKKRKVQLGYLLILMVTSSLAELFSLASVIPFLSLISDSESIWKYQIIRNYSYKFGIFEPNDLIVPFTLLFIISSFTAAFIRLTNIWLNYKLAAKIGSDLSLNAYNLILNQPYESYLKKNSSEIITTLSRQIDYTVIVIGFTLQLITSSLVALGLLTALLLTNWKVALVAGFTVGIIYLIVIKKTKKILLKNSIFIADSMQIQVKNLQEGLGGIRDIILNGSQKTFLNIYSKNDFPRRDREAYNQYLYQFPKIILEFIAIIFISILALILVSKSSSKSEVITILGALALGAQRLLPATQLVYSSWVGIKGNSASVIEVIKMLSLPKIINNKKRKSKLTFKKKIQLININYSYKTNIKIIKSLNLTISKGEKIGIVGTTGSGKTTLADIIMGLLKPDSGLIKIDDTIIYPNKSNIVLQSWRENISHIPQHIFLKDSSVLENIAFGVKKNNIDLKRIQQAVEISLIKDFIEDELGSYDTLVGEKGIRLSGGQLQRIGIARALYRDSDILVMDEATSALDERTERTIIQAINTLNNKPTIIMIAHRLSTLISCDRIINIEKGEIIEEGTPEEIIPNLSKKHFNN